MTKLQIAIKRIEDAILNAGAVLEQLEKREKESSKPEAHKWKHGDVFKYGDVTMIYLSPLSGPVVLSLSCQCTGDCPVERHLQSGEFLFNIQEEL